MKVVAYGIRPAEKGILAQANQKKHDITLIFNPLTVETAFYAQGKEAVIVFKPGEVTASMVEILATLGVRYIASLSFGSGTLISERVAADRYGILWASITVLSPTLQESSLKDLQQIAAQTIRHLDRWQLLA